MRFRMICADQSLVDGPGYLATGESYRVGRSSRCSFVLDDLSVSRFHAEVTVEDETVRIKDMKSRNGTFVDGVRIDEAQLQPGQAVRFGSAQFHLITDQNLEVPEHEVSEVSTHLMNHPLRPLLQPDALKLLSGGQRRVLDLLVKGLAEKEVASRLFISPHTVHNHVKEIYRKMEVGSRAELIALFVTESNKPV